MAERIEIHEATPKSLENYRKALGKIRETSGLEDVALLWAKAIRKSAESLRSYEDVFHTFLEEHLIWQHVFMEERDKPQKERDDERSQHALKMMAQATVKAEEYRWGNALEEFRGVSLRFQGKSASYKGEHDKALELYQESKKHLLILPEWHSERIRWIEVQGFEAEVLIMTGRSKEGLALARRTWVIYPMHEFDMYTHKVWQSGVAIAAVRALLATGEINVLGKEGAEKWLDEAQALLVIPEDMETWGDRNFAIRRREIRKLKDELQNY